MMQPKSLFLSEETLNAFKRYAEKSYCYPKRGDKSKPSVSVFLTKIANDEALLELISRHVRGVSKSDYMVILKPLKPVTKVLAKIKTDEQHIFIHFPVKIEEFRKIVRYYGFRWDETRWVKKLDPRFHPSPADRIAEIGCALLEQGFCVVPPSEEIQQKILDEDFEPEPVGWVDNKNGFFSVSWRREEDLYSEVTSLSGSRYNSETKTVFVQKEFYNEVKDFADKNGLAFTEEARALLQEAEQNWSKAIVFVKKEKKKKEDEPLLTEATGEIDESLLDD